MMPADPCLECYLVNTGLKVCGDISFRVKKNHTIVIEESSYYYVEDDVDSEEITPWLLEANYAVFRKIMNKA